MIYRPKPGSYAATLIDALRVATTPMTSKALADITGVAAENIASLLDAAVRYGLVGKQTGRAPGRGPAIEYFAIQAARSPTGSPAGTAATLNPLLTVMHGRPTYHDPQHAGGDGAQPAVARNTGSRRSASHRGTVPAEATAVAPKPPQARATPPVRPAARNVSGKLGFTIDDGGTLAVFFNDGMCEPLVFDAAETLALGDFLHLSEGLWRP